MPWRTMCISATCVNTPHTHTHVTNNIPSGLESGNELRTREFADSRCLALPCKHKQEHIIGLDSKVIGKRLHAIHSHSLAREVDIYTPIDEFEQFNHGVIAQALLLYVPRYSSNKVTSALDAEALVVLEEVEVLPVAVVVLDDASVAAGVVVDEEEVVDEEVVVVEEEVVVVVVVVVVDGGAADVVDEGTVWLDSGLMQSCIEFVSEMLEICLADCAQSRLKFSYDN
jgi:hypothetical protein